MSGYSLNDRFRLDSPAHPGFTVLLVDSDRSLLESLGRRLEQQGYQTLTAQSGEAAIEIAQSCPLHLILTELRLPDTDALAVCDQLAAEPGTCHIPVIILSNMSRPDIIRRSRVSGCQYFVRKPFDAVALLFLIRHALEETAHAAV